MPLCPSKQGLERVSARWVQLAEDRSVRLSTRRGGNIQGGESRFDLVVRARLSGRDCLSVCLCAQGPVIENISRRCGGFLRQLSLRGCQSIGNNSMRTLAQSCPNIEELNLSQCKKISDATCAALSSHCPKLQRLNLDSCPEITDISLKDLSDGCPLLTHINLSWCELLTDNGVEALARGCPELRSFLSKGCRQLTDRAVKCLARYCPNLEAINLHECRVLISLAPQIRVTPRHRRRRREGGRRNNCAPPSDSPSRSHRPDSPERYRSIAFLVAGDKEGRLLLSLPRRVIKTARYLLFLFASTFLFLFFKRRKLGGWLARVERAEYLHFELDSTADGG